MDRLLAAMEKQSAEFASLTQMHHQLLSKYADLASELANVKGELQTLQRQTSAQRLTSTPPGFDFAKAIRDSFLEADLYKKKSVVAVIEKLPENNDEDSTAAGDRELIEKIAVAAGLSDSVVLDGIHRHGGKTNGRARIVKVPFRTKEDRDSFLYGFRKALQKVPNHPLRISTRRDMVPSELSRLYELRSEAWKRNQESGAIKFIVIDLKIVELKKPHPFPAKNT